MRYFILFSLIFISSSQAADRDYQIMKLCSSAYDYQECVDEFNVNKRYKKTRPTKLPERPIPIKIRPYRGK